MASLTLSQTRTVNMDGTYSVTNTITAATGMPPEVFVFTTSTQTYDHVAAPFDLQTYPNTSVTPMAFYRQSSVTQVFKDVDSAVTAAASIKTIVSDLVVAYGELVATFPGSDTTTYTG